jgi:hypothetical protein
MIMEYRGYSLAYDKCGLVKIEPVGKGSVHKELRGLYTRKAEAKQAINAFLESRKGKNENGTSLPDS